MRILLHPSVEPLLGDSSHNPKPLPLGASRLGASRLRAIDCPDTDLANKAAVRHELDYWDLSPSKESSAWHGFQDMWTSAPDSAIPHYTATAEAINCFLVAAPGGKVRRGNLVRLEQAHA